MTKNKGFTLIELIVVILVTAIIGSVIALTLQEGVKNYTLGRAVSQLSLEANDVVNRINKELRNAQSLSQATSTTLTFINHEGTSIAYSLSGSTLNRKQGTGSNVIMSDKVQNLALSYYTNALAATTTLADIRLITLSLTLSDTQHQYALVSTTYPRALL